MKKIDFVSYSPKEFEEMISSIVSAEFKKIRKDLQSNSVNEYMTRKEVADFLKISLSTVYLWTKQGRLKAVGICNRVYYKRSEIEKSIKPLKY